MKIVFVLSSLNSGGLENYLLRFLSFYQKRIQAYVICKSGNKGIDLVNKYEELGVAIIPIRLGYFNLLHYYKLFLFFKKNNFDSICDFTGNFAALTLLVAKFAGIKKRLVFFRKDTNTFKETPYKLLYNKLLNLLLPKVSTNILSNSISNLNFFFNNKWKQNPKYEVIYNGIDASKFLKSKDCLREELNIPGNAFVVGHVGRYNQAKNHNTIIEVAVQLCKQDTINYFLFCGKDTDVFLNERVLEEGLEKQIKLLGMRSDVYKVLNTLDCFYFPSLSEGQPNALIEALVAGLPFVASNIEPNKETIPEKYHTQLIDPLDVRTAVEKIEFIKRNEDFANTLNISEWAISNYNPEKLFNKFFEKL